MQRMTSTFNFWLSPDTQPLIGKNGLQGTWTRVDTTFHGFFFTSKKHPLNSLESSLHLYCLI